MNNVSDIYSLERQNQQLASGTEFALAILKYAALGCLVLWTMFANFLVFVVLYKNPRLQTVPNLLVGNLAFSDLCLSLAVLPLSVVYAVTLKWPFGKLICEMWVSIDILSCTASIWNLCMIGLDRYWAITSPVTYMTKRNARTAVYMILSVWLLSALISLAPFLGWRHYTDTRNYVFDNFTDAYQCGFLKLPAYTVYSATGSFYIPLMVMVFVYFQIYRAFADHRARQIYRQKVIRKHIESTILHEISHMLPTSDEFAKTKNQPEEDEEDFDEDDEEDEDEYSRPMSIARKISGSTRRNNERAPLRRSRKGQSGRRRSQRSSVGFSSSQAPERQRSLTYERVQRHKTRPERRAMLRGSLQKKPKAICAAKEKRGVKVLGIILGCFTVCWFPFFVMYLLLGFSNADWRLNGHVEQFITWLGYSNSAMNPIIYTVFNREYQTALKKIFRRKRVRV